MPTSWAAVARRMEKARATEGVQDELPHFTVPDVAAIVKAKSQLDRSPFDLTIRPARLLHRLLRLLSNLNSVTMS